MTTELTDPPGRVVLYDLTWEEYRRIADAITDRHVRLAYHQGTLEVKTISGAHGNLSRLLGQFLYAVAEEFGLPRRSFGDMTCNREAVESGIEADECFYITNEPAVRHRATIDLAVDPPPDLMIEVELSRPRRTRSAIRAALGVPEVWRCDGQTVRLELLSSDGVHLPAEISRCLPGFRPADLGPFLARRTAVDEGTLVREVRAHARQVAAQRRAP